MSILSLSLYLTGDGDIIPASVGAGTVGLVWVDVDVGRISIQSANSAALRKLAKACNEAADQMDLVRASDRR